MSQRQRVSVGSEVKCMDIKLADQVTRLIRDDHSVQQAILSLVLEAPELTETKPARSGYWTNSEVF